MKTRQDKTRQDKTTFFNQKGIISQVIMLLIMVIGLFGGYYLVTHRTQLFSKAAPILSGTPETSFVLELEKTPETPFPDEDTPESIEVGKKFRVDIYARSDVDPANLFVAKLKYPTDLVSVDSIEKRSGTGTLVKQWVDASVDNTKGELSAVGGVPSPGVQTDIKENYLFASVILTAKKEGGVTLSFGDETGIYRNKDNVNVVSKRDGLSFKVAKAEEAKPSPQPVPTLTCEQIVVGNAIQAKNGTGIDSYVLYGGGSVKLDVKYRPSDKTAKVTYTASGGKIDQQPDQIQTASWTSPESNVTEDTEYTINTALAQGEQKANCPQIKVQVKKQPSKEVIKPGVILEKDLKRNGDINGDNKFSYVDMSSLLSQFNLGSDKKDAITEADLNGDKVVNTFDLVKERDVLKEKGVLGEGAQACTFVTKWGDPNLRLSGAIATDNQGNVYVIDNIYTRNSFIKKFGSSGQLITKWGTNLSNPGMGTGSGGTPGDGEFLTNALGKIATDNQGNVYVLSGVRQGGIQKFDSNGNFLSKLLGTEGKGNGQFWQPSSITVDDQGKIYIGDNGDGAIGWVQEFDSSWRFLTRLSTFSYPAGIDIDAQGNIYVSESSESDVKKFSSTGQFIKKWGNDITQDGRGSSVDGQFNVPLDVVTDSQGNVYVVDAYNYRVQKFDSNGKFITKFGSKGSGDGQFNDLEDTDRHTFARFGISIDSQGNIYVADTGNHRIQKFACTR